MITHTHTHTHTHTVIWVYVDVTRCVYNLEQPPRKCSGDRLQSLTWCVITCIAPSFQAHTVHHIIELRACTLVCTSTLECVLRAVYTGAGFQEDSRLGSCIVCIGCFRSNFGTSCAKHFILRHWKKNSAYILINTNWMCALFYMYYGMEQLSILLFAKLYYSFYLSLVLRVSTIDRYFFIVTIFLGKVVHWTRYWRKA